MYRFALMTLFCLLAGPVLAGTFELSDPAKEILQEQQAQPEEAVAERPVVPAASAVTRPGMRCTMDLDDGLCFCNDKKTIHRLEMSQQACVSALRQALGTLHPVARD